MTKQKTNRKTIIVLSVLLSIAVLTIASLMYVYITTNSDLSDMTTKQETTAATLAATEGTLAETQAALADMTAKQETTAATLAATEGTLTETQAALADMTAKQETTAATLAATEDTLAETQAALAASEAALVIANEENSRLKATSQDSSATVDQIDTSAITLAGTNDAEYVVVKELEWEKYGSHHLALIVKNTSGQAKNVSAQVLFYNADGGLIGASNPEQYVCADGEEAYLSCTCDSTYSSYEYSIELSETNMKSMNSSIEISATINPKNVIIMAKNTGSSTPDYIEYNCVLYDQMGNVVNVAWGYIDEPAPGKMTFREISSYETFETIEIYYSAHSFGF